MSIVLIIGAVLIQLTHKTHEIIFTTADNVMRWIGFGVNPLGSIQSGEASVMGSVQGGMQQTAPLLGQAAMMRQASNRRGAPGGAGGGKEPSAAASKQGQAEAQPSQTRTDER